MKNEPNILLTPVSIFDCDPPCGSGLRFLVLSNMGTRSDETATVATATGLGRLTPRELEACALHLADGWPQATVADWLGLSRRGVQLLLESAAAKVPPLRSLRVRARRPVRRPRVLHLSQLAAAESGPFDADDL
jgi:hypothetical protein